ncbi:MAG: DUF4190 domain-containing protein [Nocardioides sp.]
MTTGPENPYGEQPPQPDPHQPPPYGYPQQPPPYGYPQQPPPYGYPAQYAFQPPVPSHPSATTAMVLGIVGLAGIMTCGGITLVLSPFAWIIGARSAREIKANPETYGGLSSANAGRVMGIVGTILLILGVLAVVAMFAWFASVEATTFETTYESGY